MWAKAKSAAECQDPHLMAHVEDAEMKKKHCSCIAAI